MFKDLKNNTLRELHQIAKHYTDKRYFADYIFSFIHSKNVTTISEIIPLPQAIRQRLTSDGYSISQLKIIDKLKDKDGTVKILFSEPIACSIKPERQIMTLAISMA